MKKIVNYRQILRLGIVAFILVMSTISLVLYTTPVEASSSVFIYTTDQYGNPKYDFYPGEFVYVHGEGFLSNSLVNIDITRPDAAVDSGSTFTDINGYFIYVYDLDGIYGLYLVEATDGTNSATTTFTDAPLRRSFRQYANIPDDWIGSILQTSNCLYYEGMSVPQRTAFANIIATTGDIHTLTFSHMATKGGFHAYDWLTGWNQGNSPPLGYNPWGPSYDTGIDGPFLQALHTKTGVYEYYLDVPDDPFISKDGSTQSRIDAYELAHGNRRIRICGNQPIISASFTSMYHDVTNGADTGDSTIYYELTWVSTSDEILIEMAGHLALSGNPATYPIAWGINLGSHYISGGPAHFKLYQLDGHSIGNQDNQIMAAAILPLDGCLEVTKVVDWGDVTPDPGQTFTVTVTGPSHPSPGTSHVFGSTGGTWTLNNLIPGSYTVTENDPGSNWIVTPSLTQTVTVEEGTPCATATITNTYNPGCLDVEKFVDWDGMTPDTGKTFWVTLTGPSYPSGTYQFPFDYDGGTWTENNLIPGIYWVNETDPGPDWIVTPGLNQQITVNSGTPCATATITNTYNAGCLVITKTVDWDGMTPDTGKTFWVTLTGPSYPSGTYQFPFDYDGGTWTENNLIPGIYWVNETDPGPDWIVTPGLNQQITVNSGTPCATATITNTYSPGCLDVEKFVDWDGITPDTSETFTIHVSGPGGYTNTLTFPYNGGTQNLAPLAPGVYSLYEDDPGSEWIWDSSTHTVPVDPGTPCAYDSFTNTYSPGCLDVEKFVDWDGITPDTSETFTIHVSGPGGYTNTLTFPYNGGTQNLAPLAPGVYSLYEDDPGSEWIWDSSTHTVPVDPGTPCAYDSFTNTYSPGCLDVEKFVDWDGITPDTSETFTIHVSGPGGYTNTLTFPYNGGTQNLAPLAPGVYSLYEDDPGSEWIWDSSTHTVPVDPGTPCAYDSFTNTYSPGCLDVEKFVDWDGITPDTSETFTIHVSGPGGYTNTLTFPYNGGTQNLAPLAPGVYSLYEDDPGSEWIWDSSTHTVPVDPGTPCAYDSFTNTYSPGCLDVEKFVDWDGITPDTSETFTIHVSGPGGYTNTLTFPYNGGTQNLAPLAPGVYSLYEDDPGSEWIWDSSTHTVPVDPGTPCAYDSFTNTYSPGCLDVEKFVDWDGITPDTSETFTIHVSGPGGYTNTLTFPYNGGTQNLAPLAPGVYSLYEDDPGSEWIWDSSTHTVPVDPGTPCAYDSFTNTYSPGCLDVEKFVDWDGITPDTSETFTIHVSGPGGYTNTLTFPYNGGTQNLAPLAPGVYSLYEDDPGSEWIWDSSTHTVPVDPGTPCAYDSFTNTYSPGCLEVYKTVEWNGITPWSMDVVVEVIGPSPSIDLVATIHFDENGDPVPAGSNMLGPLVPGDYTITEIDPGSPWIVTGSPQTVTVLPGDSCATHTIYNEVIPGCLEVTKSVVDIPFGVPKTFEICITGPSYPSGDCQTVSETGGVLTWDPLIPGDYTVTETYPGAEWIVTGEGTVTVNSGTPCTTVTITNTYDPPCILEVWVDDDFHTGTPGWFYDHFPTIQDAVEVVDVGGIVHVYPGIYTGDIILDTVPCDNTDITIEGILGCPPLPIPGAAVITGSIIIRVDGVTIRNFVFQDNEAGSIIVEGRTGITLRCNVFLHNCNADSIGVDAWEGSYVDAECNWWGAPNGPNGGIMDDGAIADGYGVKIIGSGLVYVEPWAGVHAEITASKTEIEPGECITFNAEPESFAHSIDECTELEYAVLWDYDDGYFSQDKLVTHCFDSPGTYQVSLRVRASDTIVHPGFMYDWDYITITVKDPSAPLTANAGGGSLSQYENEINIDFNLLGSAFGGSPPYTYTWDLGDGRTADSNIPTVKYNNEGSYTVTLTVTDQKGDNAIDSAQVEIKIGELDIIIINSPSQIKQGQIISFRSLVFGGKAPYTHMWKFGDGKSSSAPYPTHTYQSDGTYNVELTVTDSSNNEKTAYNTIIVKKSEEATEELISVNAGFGLKATIKAGGESVIYSINMDGSVFFGGNTDGEIAANTQETVKIPLSLGLGKVYIVISVNQALYKYEAFMLGPFILNLKEYYG